MADSRSQRSGNAALVVVLGIGLVVVVQLWLIQDALDGVVKSQKSAQGLQSSLDALNIRVNDLADQSAVHSRLLLELRQERR